MDHVGVGRDLGRRYMDRWRDWRKGAHCRRPPRASSVSLPSCTRRHLVARAPSRCGCSPQRGERYGLCVQLTPRYDGSTVLRIELLLPPPSVPLIRQRRRLAETLEGLDEAQWASPSRCEAWSVQDVVTHLLSTNQFWAASIASGLAGTPTRFLATFDPVTTPAALVDGMRTLSPADVLAQYVETVDALAAAVGDVSDDAWSRPAEAPPGHIELRGVALHALWDAWIHERDICVPLGLVQPAEDDEIQAGLV